MDLDHYLQLEHRIKLAKHALVTPCPMPEYVSAVARYPMASALARMGD